MTVIRTKRPGRGTHASRRRRGWSSAMWTKADGTWTCPTGPLATLTALPKTGPHMSEGDWLSEMPPKKYTLIHADARLTDADRKE